MATEKEEHWLPWESETGLQSGIQGMGQFHGLVLYLNYVNVIKDMLQKVRKATSPADQDRKAKVLEDGLRVKEFWGSNGSLLQ